MFDFAEFGLLFVLMRIEACIHLPLLKFISSCIRSHSCMQISHDDLLLWFFLTETVESFDPFEGLLILALIPNAKVRREHTQA